MTGTENGNGFERWRGEQTAILRLVKEELTAIDGRLRSLEREVWIIKGQAALIAFAVSGVVGVAATIIASLIGGG